VAFNWLAERHITILAKASSKLSIANGTAMENDFGNLWLHFVSSVALFFIVNWIGRHADAFGYSSLDLVDTDYSSHAFNYLVKAVSPTIFILILSAAYVQIERPDWRFGIWMVAPIYFLFRSGFVIALDRATLVDWVAIAFRAVSGSLLAYWAYIKLILPVTPLIPDMQSISNELWVIIILFMYSISNRVTLSDVRVIRRKNAYIKARYERAIRNYASILNSVGLLDATKLAAYSIIIFEGFNRPPAARFLERTFFRRGATTGEMQASAPRPLTDAESVTMGAKLLKDAQDRRLANGAAAVNYTDIKAIIADYNRDEAYVAEIVEIMEIVAARVDRDLKPIIEKLYSPA
jgi:hypothetical protein